jgi:hypothetical protein
MSSGGGTIRVLVQEIQKGTTFQMETEHGKGVRHHYSAYEFQYSSVGNWEGFGISLF